MAVDNDSNVLLLGESGVGKDMFAQAIHNASNRSQGLFLAINCAALPRELISSELFGYEDGAFTGARKGGNPGKFELADQGTMFLDEIGEMPLDMQASLLRVLENGTV
jgi:transcriptional regulator with PAS, ATPase and Fis domain